MFLSLRVYLHDCPWVCLVVVHMIICRVGTKRDPGQLQCPGGSVIVVSPIWIDIHSCAKTQLFSSYQRQKCLTIFSLLPAAMKFFWPLVWSMSETVFRRAKILHFGFESCPGKKTTEQKHVTSGLPRGVVWEASWGFTYTRAMNCPGLMSTDCYFKIGGP